MGKLGRITEKTIKKSKFGKIIRSYRLKTNDVNTYTLFDVNGMFVERSTILSDILNSYNNMIKKKLNYINPNNI